MWMLLLASFRQGPDGTISTEDDSVQTSIELCSQPCSVR
jgi:hypothetical protein